MSEKNRNQENRNQDSPGLQHAPAGAALARSGARSGLIARGRREASASAANPHNQKAVEAYKAGHHAPAVEGFRLAAGEGHAEAQYMLSTLYDDGRGVERDEAQAAHWERKAAEQGHAYAQANLSFRHYAAGEYAEAFAWCQRAAWSRLAWAEYHLGLMYRKGEGVAQSTAEAAHWYRLAAAQGFPEAELKLAELYLFGLGVPRSHAQAASWFRRAAEHGSAEAQYQLGHLYATGQGVEHDYTQSRYWIRQAAQQGHEQAAVELKRREYRDP